MNKDKTTDETETQIENYFYELYTQYFSLEEKGLVPSNINHPITDNVNFQEIENKMKEIISHLRQSEAQKLEEVVKVLIPKYKALQAVVNQFFKDTEDYDELLRSEVLLMAFERDTGIWPCGKSAPMDMVASLEPMDVRMKAQQEWFSILNEARTFHHKALTSREDLLDDNK